ncbi:SHOCT domain-containing protein [Orrella marina]|uniref:SHOCT domain-containing protein n=1 Tax=Orrella marina TaxID=2163011 RepID=A0A2R4XNZ5_9BURK|nr:hypothetical protein DBV39_19285 [Orrella marina]
MQVIPQKTTCLCVCGRRDFQASELKDRGLITQNEFEAQKAKVLAR